MATKRPSLSSYDEGPDTELIKKKYAEVAKNRNAFIAKFFVGTIAMAVLLTIPKWVINRSQTYFWRKYLRGDVLTLTPKLLESAVVEQLEGTNTARVFCIVSQRIKSDQHYSEVLEACTTEAQRQQATRDMTMCFLKSNDPHWVHSTITFDTMLESQAKECFECVIVDNELWHTSDAATEDMLKTAARALKPDGHLVLTDVAAPAFMRNAVRNLRKRTESDINLAHDYVELLNSHGLSIVEQKAAVCGFYQCYAAQRKQLDTANDATAK